MKNFFAISAGALFALVMMGCNSNGLDSEGEAIVTVVTSVEEKTGSDVFLTEYKWDENAVLIGESKRLNGSLLWEDNDYEYDEENWIITCYRTIYNPEGGESIRQKRVTWYFPGWWYGTYKGEVYELGVDADTTPIESWEKTYETDYDSKTIRLTSYTIKENGLVVFRQSDFAYGVSGSKDVTYSQKEGSDPGVTMFRKYASDDSYKIYADWDGMEGKLVEEQTDYEPGTTTTLKTTYGITKYDEEGNPTVKTDYVFNYEIITVKITN